MPEVEDWSLPTLETCPYLISDHLSSHLFFSTHFFRTFNYIGSEGKLEKIIFIITTIDINLLIVFVWVKMFHNITLLVMSSI